MNSKHEQEVPRGYFMDTHTAVKTLIESGMPEKQAESVVSIQSRLLDRNLVTKTDIAELKNDLAEFRTDIKSLKSEMKAVFAEIRAEFASLKSETKADFALLKSETKTEFAEIRTDFASLKSETIRWVVGINFATAVLVVSILKYL